MQKPKKWLDVYPQGTKDGDEEQKVFISLARHKIYPWRSLSAIVAESGLSKDRVLEILTKYEKKGMVFHSPTNEKNWGYWERHPELLKDDSSISKKDKDNRINQAKTP